MSKPVDYFALSWKWDSKEVLLFTDSLFCHWMYSNNNMTVNCVFISGFISHARRSPATSASIPAGFLPIIRIFVQLCNADATECMLPGCSPIKEMEVLRNHRGGTRTDKGRPCPLPKYIHYWVTLLNGIENKR